MGYEMCNRRIGECRLAHAFAIQHYDHNRLFLVAHFQVFARCPFIGCRMLFFCCFWFRLLLSAYFFQGDLVNGIFFTLDLVCLIFFHFTSEWIKKKMCAIRTWKVRMITRRRRHSNTSTDMSDTTRFSNITLVACNVSFRRYSDWFNLVKMNLNLIVNKLRFDGRSYVKKTTKAKHASLFTRPRRTYRRVGPPNCSPCSIRISDPIKWFLLPNRMNFFKRSHAI